MKCFMEVYPIIISINERKTFGGKVFMFALKQILFKLVHHFGGPVERGSEKLRTVSSGTRRKERLLATVQNIPRGFFRRIGQTR